MNRASEKCRTLSSATAYIYWEYQKREKKEQKKICKEMTVNFTFIEKQKPVGPESPTMSK